MHPLLKLLEKHTLTEIATVCGITPQAVYDWRRRAEAGAFEIPAEHVRKLCQYTGVKPAQLRPDLFDLTWRYKK